MLHSAVRSICARAGWKEPKADEKGVYAFDLEDDISFTLSSPDGERLLARSALLAPMAGRDIAGETLASVMRITAARFKRLKAAVALNPETGVLELYALTDPRGAETPEEFMEKFLNELSFWKAQPSLGVSTAFTTRG